jgi:hypothetical protein
MATIELTKSELVVRIRGWNVVHAMCRTLRISLGHVHGVRVRPTEADFDHAIVEGWRGIGTYVPRTLAAGLLHLRNGPSFLEVRDPAHTIGLDVENVRVWGYRVNHLVLQVDRETPEAAASRIVQAIARFIGSASAKTAPTTLPSLVEPRPIAAEVVAHNASAALGHL